MPLDNIVFDVFGNTIQFILITDNAIVETCLPGKWNVVGVGETGNTRLQTTDNRS